MKNIYELAPVLELTNLVLPVKENARVSDEGKWSYTLVV